MPSLQVRDLPEAIYHSLFAEAVLEHRSITQQAVAVLARGLQIDANQQQRRKFLLARIQAVPDTGLLPDPAEMVREDRER